MWVFEGFNVSQVSFMTFVYTARSCNWHLQTGETCSTEWKVEKHAGISRFYWMTSKTCRKWRWKAWYSYVHVFQDIHIVPCIFLWSIVVGMLGITKFLKKVGGGFRDSCFHSKTCEWWYHWLAGVVRVAFKKRGYKIMKGSNHGIWFSCLKRPEPMIDEWL